MDAALGLEPTPEAYIAHLVLCFREIRRVLRDDGVAWCVMGDSYVSHKPRANATHEAEMDQTPAFRAAQLAVDLRGKGGFNSGDLMLIPHRLALALQGDGWTCRNDVVWAKKAPMPESVAGWRWERCRVKVAKSERAEGNYNAAAYSDSPQGESKQYGIDGSATWTDCPGCAKCEKNGGYVLRRGSWRHTRAHEVVLMLTKGMGYFCDQEKVREGNHITHRKAGKDGAGSGQDGRRALGFEQSDTITVGRNPRSVPTADELDELWCMFLEWLQNDNPLDVLTPKPEPYKKDHYAVFPSTLITPLIRASCPAKCCPVCGAAWAAVVEKAGNPYPGSSHDHSKDQQQGNTQTHVSGIPAGTIMARRWYEKGADTILGYRPTCTHYAEPVPGTVLDPFFGAGTTGLVADRLGLNCIGIELSEKYVGMSANRIEEDAGMFASVNTVT